MKLTELAPISTARQVSQVFESYFEQRVNFDRVPRAQARTMLQRVRGLINEHRSSPAFHRSERNPAYLKLVMMEQALTHRLKEQANNSTIMQDQRRLNESEVQQAQVVLAAQDMVDNVQGMIEDATEMQFKELPALVDQIKNQVGPDQAAQFNNDASAALAAVVQSLQGSKQQLDAALGVVTGQPSPAMPSAGAMAPAAPGAIMPPAGADATPDLDQDIDVDLDVEEPAPARAALGRERRK